MKKILLVLLALVLVFSMAACGGGGGDTGGDANGGDEGGQLLVGFAQLGSESDWRVGSTVSILNSVEEAGFELQFVDANQQQENQIRALRDFITMGVDYIGFSPVVESGWDQVMQEIKEAGIPVIMLDRNIDMPNREDYYVTWIGSNFVEEGEKAGQWLVDYLEDVGSADEEINIVELQGTVGSSPAIDRKTGFENIIGDHPNLTITQSQTGDFTTELGKTVMESFLKSGERIDVLYAHNDGMAIGAIQAIKEAGLVPGEDIIVIGVDAVKLAFEAILAGDMNVTVECTPLLGPQFVQAIKDIEAGKTLPKVTYSIEYIYDMHFYNNAEEELPNRVY
jgi:simple sugar transport system substrate-binding protein